jgi:predicted lipoprotein with Yx(FWY)xxD motif
MPPAVLLIGLLLGAPAVAGAPAGKPPPGRTVFESTRPPASDEESRAVAAAVAGYRGEDPALFVRGLLVDRRGMTLYTFDRDRANVSTCYRACEKLWPPLLAGFDALPRGDFGIAERMDGARQWTFRGKPLYRWPSDKKPGDVTGDNVSGVWHVVPEAPAATPVPAR